MFDVDTLLSLRAEELTASFFLSDTPHEPESLEDRGGGRGGDRVSAGHLYLFLGLSGTDCEK